MDIFALDTKLNISRAYLRPGFSFGGSCLPKDVQALSAQARKTGLKTPVLSSLMQANEDQIARAADMIESSGRRNILLLGLAFKDGTDDLRNSPLLRLANILIQKNYTLTIYDPAISQKDFALKTHLTDDADTALQAADAVIIGNGSEEFAKIAENIPPQCFILDLARINNPAMRKQENYAGICW
jgi:GDP-mannose 6-dehydrogenase